MSKVTMSLKKENKYITGSKELKYFSGYIGYIVTMNKKEKWDEFEALDYLQGLEKYLNEFEIDFYIYEDSYVVIENIIKVTLVVCAVCEAKFKETYKCFKVNHEDIVLVYSEKPTKVDEPWDHEEQDFINEQELNETKELLKEYEEKANYMEKVVDEILNNEENKKFQVENFVFAGNATFTLESEKTGNRYTYKVRQCEDKKELYFVSLLTGSDNESDYQYLGVVENGKFRTTKKSKLTIDSTPVKAFNFFISKLHKLNKIEGLNIFHAGRCGKCGKKLTTPESIKTGFGPHCREGL
jgi:hypothetical protein